MKYLTFNIRYDCRRDGINNFDLRKPLILRTLEEEKPDVIGFQEVLPHVARYLRDTLTDYSFAGCPRDENLQGEQVCVAWRRHTVNLLEMRTLWLSPAPFTPGSRYPDQSDCPRTATFALLEDVAQGKVFRVVNTHLDHVGQESRTLALRQIFEELERPCLFPEAPLILGGDFNAEPDSPEMQILYREKGLQVLTDHLGMTYHGFGGPHTSLIDYICIRGSIAAGDVRKWDRAEEGVYLSDHYPISADLTLL